MKYSILVGLLNQTMQTHISWQLFAMPVAFYDAVIDVLVKHVWGCFSSSTNIATMWDCQCRWNCICGIEESHQSWTHDFALYIVQYDMSSYYLIF